MTATANVVTSKSCSLDEWRDKWESGNIPWHKTVVNPQLEKYIRDLDGGKKNLRIFVPLCGKSFDMKWLADLGHTVVGVECSSTAVQQFFKENELEYTVETCNGLTVYQERSGHISLYCCSIFDFDKAGEGPFDAIWDRGSLTAINVEDRTRYMELVSSLKTVDCRHLLVVYEYDDNLHNGFPCCLPVSTVETLFGDKYHVELLDTADASDVGRRFSDHFNLCVRNLFLVTQK